MMMTDLARTRIRTETRTRTPARAPTSVFTAVAIGMISGCALGIIARAWMRLISKDPEFTWSGTIFIVAGFTVFGLAQSLVAVARQRVRRRLPLTIIRMFGAIAMLPLFVAAGSLMFPTVLGCGLAVARTGWHPLVRALCLLVAAGPVVFVGSDLVGSFGWSLHALVGFVLMLAVYATIIRATRFTFSARPVTA